MDDRDGDEDDKAGLTDDEKAHARALEVYQLCIENERDNRADFKDDLEFGRLGIQWPDKVKRQRDLEGRPCLTNNLLPAFIRQVVNEARQNKPSITVHPADDDADPETAEVIEDLIRNIEVSSNAEVAYDTGLEMAVSGGFGYIRVNTEYCSDDTFEQDLIVSAVTDPLTIYGDPFDNGADSANWNHAFVVTSMAADAFEDKYPDAEPVDWESGVYAGLPDDWRNGDDVVVAEYWCREPSPREITALSNGDVIGVEEFEAHAEEFAAAGIGMVGKPRTVQSHKVVQRTMTGAEVIETTAWAGRYIPIIPVYGEDIMVDGKRHLRSMIRDAKDAMRQRNYHQSAVTELVALAPRAPFIGKKGTFNSDQAKWETANSESHAYLEYDGEAPARQPFAGVPAGEMQQVLMASDDMKAIMGLHDASLGARSNETSGTAINARKLEGDVSTFNFVDNLTRAMRHVGRVLIDMIPETYSVSRIIRVMGKDGTPRKVPINQDPSQGPPMQDGDGADNEAGERLKVYNLTVGKYDLVVKAGPSFSSRREEAATQMLELMKVMPAAAPVMGDLLAKNLDWPGADEVATRLHALLPPQVLAAMGGPDGKGGGVPQVPAAQAQAQVAQITQQAKQALAEQGQKFQQQAQAAQATDAAMQKLQLQFEALKSDRALEAKKLEIEAYDAQTRRMVAGDKAVADVTAANEARLVREASATTDF